MIDSVALVWGLEMGTDARRVDAPGAGRRVEPLSEPVRLDWDYLRDRLGSEDGQIRTRQYGERTWTGGHWPLEDVGEIMYRAGRVEVRASLPKLLAGRNDVVLTEAQVHEALRALAHKAEVVLGHDLPLEQAVPSRLDFAFQWEVPSVTRTLVQLKVVAPKRRQISEEIAPHGGRTLYWGKKSKWPVRFYDKAAEMLASGEASEHDLDTLLRYEIQDRRRPRLRLVHERGYTGEAVREALLEGLQPVTNVEFVNADELLASYGRWPHAVAYTLAAYALANHPELWRMVERRSRSSTSRWRGRVRQLSTERWTPVIPLDAFEPSRSLWDEVLPEAA
jgi:hypothetical protein